MPAVVVEPEALDTAQEPTKVRAPRKAKVKQAIASAIELRVHAVYPSRESAQRYLLVAMNSTGVSIDMAAGAIGADVADVTSWFVGDTTTVTSDQMMALFDRLALLADEKAIDGSGRLSTTETLRTMLRLAAPAI
jgi:hypothetical protein